MDAAVARLVAEEVAAQLRERLPQEPQRPVMHRPQLLLRVDAVVALRAEVEVAADVEAAAAQQSWMFHRRRRKAH